MDICTLRDTMYLLAFSAPRKLLALAGSEDLTIAISCRAKVSLLVQDNSQEGFVDADLAVVLDEASLPKFVHEKINSGPGCANHLRQHLLRYFGKHLLRLVLVVALPALFVLTEPNANGLREHQMEGVAEVPNLSNFANCSGITAGPK